MTKWGLSVAAALVLNLSVSPRAAQPEREPGGPITPTREQLESALLEIGAERDALRLALRAAQDEIARSRASYAAIGADLTACEQDLTRSLELTEAAMQTYRTLDGLLTAERKAAKRQRWTEWLRIGLPSLAGGYVLGELSGE